MGHLSLHGRTNQKQEHECSDFHSLDPLHRILPAFTSIDLSKALKGLRLSVVFQGAQVVDEIGKILSAHLIRVRRHRIRRHNLEFTKAGFLK